MILFNFLTNHRQKKDPQASFQFNESGVMNYLKNYMRKKLNQVLLYQNSKVNNF